MRVADLLKTAAVLTGLVGTAALGPGPAPALPPSAIEPLPGYTGGFGEPTCAECHSDYPVDDEEGSLRLLGVPESWRQSGVYTLEVLLARPGHERGGFQLSARTADGKDAGTLQGMDGRAAVTPHPETGVHYAHHTPEGIEPTAPDTSRWRIRWTAPPAPADTVYLHVAANAADYDDSELGDHIYRLSRKVRVDRGIPGRVPPTP